MVMRNTRYIIYIASKNLFLGLYILPGWVISGEGGLPLVKPTPTPFDASVACQGNGLNITYAALILFAIVLFGVAWGILRRKEG
jgi:hypothetical protein